MWMWVGVGVGGCQAGWLEAWQPHADGSINTANRLPPIRQLAPPRAALEQQGPQSAHPPSTSAQIMGRQGCSVIWRSLTKPICGLGGRCSACAVGHVGQACRGTSKQVASHAAGRASYCATHTGHAADKPPSHT